MSDHREFELALRRFWSSLDGAARERLVRFRELVVEGNRHQNLTRLISPHSFLYGHVADIKELFSLNWLSYPALDLGAGAGVPGLLAACIEPRQWVLTESEGRKAEFLGRAVERLGLTESVQVWEGRAEAFLISSPIDTVVCRAVGPMKRLFRTLKPCSTWNNLILFKGPSWKREWEAVRQSEKRTLCLKSRHFYEAGPEKKRRVVISFENLGRGVPRP